MSLPSSRATVSALGYSLAMELSERSGAGLEAPYNDVVAFIQYALERMPDHLRLPMRALTLAFDLAGLLHCGALFHRQGQASRLRQVEAWRRSSLGPCRDLMRFYGSLSAYALYSRGGVGS